MPLDLERLERSDATLQRPELPAQAIEGEVAARGQTADGEAAAVDHETGDITLKTDP